MMADLDVTGNDAALKFETHTNHNANIDEDLIDYDSDDALGRHLSLGHATNVAKTQMLDARIVTDAEATLADASEHVKTSQGYAPLPRTTGMGAGDPGQQGIHAAGEQVQDHENFDDFALGDDDTAEQVPTATGPDQARDSVHEIDYEDDGFAFDAPAAGRNQQSSTQDTGASKPQAPDSFITTAPAKQYEIDWEDDEEGAGYGTQDGAAHGGTEPTTVDAFPDNVSEEKGLDLEDEAAEAEDPVTEHEPAQTEPFPAITVQYKGEEFPMFSLSSDGFFPDVSILDENMKVVLDGFRAELAAEIGPHDDLVFQVDKLGLEFSESSPSDTLSEISLRQILEIHEILVKNKDFDNSRILYTYLFTRPNTMKRYEFLVESATGDKGLAEVMHLFQPPSQSNNVEDTAPHDDGYEDQLDSYESTGNDATAHGSHDNSEVYEDLGDGHGHNDEYQDEPGVDRDEDFVGPSTGDGTTAVGDGEPTEHSKPDDPDPGASDDAAGTHHDIGDANDETRHGDVSDLFDPAPGTIDDEQFLGTTTSGGEINGQIHYDSTHNVGGLGGERVFDHRLDPDLIDYSSAGDKNVGDNEDLLANLPNVSHGLDIELADYGAVDDKATADEDLIDYENVEDDNDGVQHGAGSLAQMSGEEVKGEENRGSVADDGRAVELDDGLIDYSADSSGEKYAAANSAIANPVAGVDALVPRDISPLVAGNHTGLGESRAFVGGPGLSHTADGAHVRHSFASEADDEASARTEASMERLLDVGADMAEAAALGSQANFAGGAADAQFNMMKRAYPEDDGDDGNDVKRRRS